MKTRREVLVQLSAGAAILCLGCSDTEEPRATGDSGAAQATRISLDAILPSRSVHLGRAYLELAARDGLKRTPLDVMFGGGSWMRLTPDAFRSQLLDRLHDDFRTGRTHAVDGWILSVTELELCAAFAGAAESG